MTVDAAGGEAGRRRRRVRVEAIAFSGKEPSRRQRMPDGAVIAGTGETLAILARTSEAECARLRDGLA